MTNLDKEISKYIKENERELKEFMPEGNMFSTNTYGKFESEGYKDVNPNEYFKSSEWHNFLKDAYFTATNTKTNTKEAFVDIISEHLDRDLEFFGQQTIADNIVDRITKNKNGQTIDTKTIFNHIMIEMYKKYGELVEIEDFLESFKEHLGGFVSKYDGSNIQDLYNNRDIYMIMSPLEKPDFVEESIMFYSQEHDAILMSEEVCEIFHMLNIDQMDFDNYYRINNQKGLKEINDYLIENDFETYELLDRENNRTAKVRVQDLLTEIKENNSSVPCIIAKVSLQELLKKHNNKNRKKNMIEIEDSVFCLAGKEKISFFNKINLNKKVRINDIQNSCLGLMDVPMHILKDVYEANCQKVSHKLKIS